MPKSQRVKWRKSSDGALGICKKVCLSYTRGVRLAPSHPSLTPRDAVEFAPVGRGPAVVFMGLQAHAGEGTEMCLLVKG